MVKHGVDGLESHSVPNLRSQIARDRSHFLLFMVSPLELKDYQGNFIWSNQYPNSRFSNQPIALLSQKENIESVTTLMNFLNLQIDETRVIENESGLVNNSSVKHYINIVTFSLTYHSNQKYRMECWYYFGFPELR
ncbi:hypothetical protein LOD99_7829 [Oopsacas minuta]|uniref:Uncharacterized protein n=1 Tax=Oopsacas minuta TaxID=111878 RepID=A0AAV7JPK0_9METZ|nr:hypothetical protein LOD99_7829 [Oopsacas minuta]